MIRLVRQVLQGEQSPLTPRQVVSTREKTCPFVGGRQIHVQENINTRVEGRHCWDSILGRVSPSTKAKEMRFARIPTTTLHLTIVSLT